MKKTILSICLLLLVTSCNKSDVKMYHNTTLTAGFDTYLTIQCATNDEKIFNDNFDKAVNEFSTSHQLFDIYHNYPGINNLKTINDNAGIAPVKVDDRIIQLLQLSKDLYTLSDGEFDVTMGSLLKVWHHYRDDGIEAMKSGKLGKIPTKEELEKASACIGWKYVEIDESNKTVFINNPCTSLDVGGIAKGFTAENMARLLENNNVSTGVVDAGGDTQTIGTKLDKTPWRVGIRHPQGDGSIIALTAEGSMSFVTSGDYERFYVGEDGNTYHHIIDPKTLYPSRHYKSVTIITKNGAIADAFSTILFILSYEDGLALINKYNSQHDDDISAIWIIEKDKQVTAQNSQFIDNLQVVVTDDLVDKIITKK